MGEDTLVGEETVEGVVALGVVGVDGESGESSDLDLDFLEDLDPESPVLDFLEDFGVEPEDRNRALTTGLN